jgi:hypothetical protein
MEVDRIDGKGWNNQYGKKGKGKGKNEKGSSKGKSKGKASQKMARKANQRQEQRKVRAKVTIDPRAREIRQAVFYVRAIWPLFQGLLAESASAFNATRLKLSAW